MKNRTKKRRGQRGLALLLSLAMCLGMVQTTALAAEGEESSEETQGTGLVEVVIDEKTGEKNEAKVTEDETNETTAATPTVTGPIAGTPVTGDEPNTEVTDVKTTYEITDGNGNKVEVELDGGKLDVTVKDEDGKVITPEEPGETEEPTEPEEPGETEEPEAPTEPAKPTDPIDEFKDAVKDYEATGEDSNGHKLTQTVRPDGAIVTTDENGKATTVFYPGDNAVETTQGNKKTVTGKDENGNQVTSTVQTNEEDSTTVTTITSKDGTTTIVADADGNVLSTTSTNADGVTTAVKDGVTTTYTKDADGNDVIIVKDADGKLVTKYPNNPDKSIQSDGSKTQSIDANGIIEKNGNTTTFVSADGKTRTQQVANADGSTVTTAITEKDGVPVITVENSNGATVTYTQKDGQWVKYIANGGNVTEEALAEGEEVPAIADIEKLDLDLDAVKPDDAVDHLETVEKSDELLGNGLEDTKKQETTTTQETDEETGKVTTTLTTQKSEVKLTTDGDDAVVQTVVTTETLTVTAEPLKSEDLKAAIGEKAYNELIEKIKNGSDDAYAPYVVKNEDGTETIYVITKVVKTTTTSDGTTSTETETTPEFNDFFYGNEDILGDVKKFAVFAKEYTCNDDMEGNIATEILHFLGGNIGVDESKLKNEFGDEFKDESHFDSTLYETNDTVSYIGQIDAPGGEVRFHTTGTALVVGSQYKDVTPESDKQNYFLKDEDGTSIKLADAQSKISGVYVASEETEIDFTTAFNQLAAYADKLQKADETAEIKLTGGDAINAQYTITEAPGAKDGRYVVNVDISWFGNNSGYINVKLPENSQLVINVTGMEEGKTYDLNRKLQMDDKDIGQWDASAGTIMLNFGEFAGTLNFGETSKGIILAPRATVNINTTHDGSVIAEKVSNKGAEIHKSTTWREPEPERPTPTPPSGEKTDTYELSAAKVTFTKTTEEKAIEVVPDPPQPAPNLVIESLDVLAFDAAPKAPTPVEEPEEPETPPEEPEDPETPPETPTTPEEPTTPPPPTTPDEDIPDEPTPLTEEPEQPEETEEEEILDEEPPLVDAPEEEEPEPEDEPEEEEIIDDDIPLARVPATGDISSVWYAMTIVAACGLLVLYFLRKKAERA